eukprot:TRINITY_DN52857_c0_g1_i1.p1 TRINITY_DN52857_c0_g1~~TRINITY_DN52857_c0_g1_i1.p1  ORF type:complete len:214 (+),score=23.39 TRINITY_DN52857_c0_g1_i1:41-643(+)
MSASFTKWQWEKRKELLIISFLALSGQVVSDVILLFLMRRSGEAPTDTVVRLLEPGGYSRCFDASLANIRRTSGTVGSARDGLGLINTSSSVSAHSDNVEQFNGTEQSTARRLDTTFESEPEDDSRSSTTSEVINVSPSDAPPEVDEMNIRVGRCVTLSSCVPSLFLALHCWSNMDIALAGTFGPCGWRLHPTLCDLTFS